MSSLRVPSPAPSGAPARGPRARPARRAGGLALLAAALVNAFATGCGSSTSIAGGYDPPPPGDPAHGASAQVLIGNQGLVIWVGIDSADTVEQLRADQRTGKVEWLIAEVVPDEAYPLGFYFAPGEVTAAEITAEGIQTTLPQIEADPSYYRVGGPGVFAKWAVLADVLKVSE